MDPILAAIIAFLTSSYGSSIAATISVTALMALVRKIPGIGKWARKKIIGTRLMMAGPSEVGKSSFLNYLKNNKFADESNVLPTNTVTVSDGFAWTDDNHQELITAKCLDVPGQLSPEDQVNEAKRYNPETIIVVLPMTNNGQISDWIKQFSKKLGAALRSDHKFRNSLTSLTFVLNKSDRLTEEVKLKLLADVEETVQSILKPLFKENIGRIGIIGCTLFKGNGGEKAAAAVAVKIALSLRNKGPLLNE